MKRLLLDALWLWLFGRTYTEQELLLQTWERIAPYIERDIAEQQAELARFIRAHP